MPAYITVTCFATLARFQPQEHETFPLVQDDTVEKVVRRLGIPADEVKIVLLNGAHADMRQKLHEGDRLGLFPAVGGG
jgi:molybdopterin converting factor small subunit